MRALRRPGTRHPAPSDRPGRFGLLGPRPTDVERDGGTGPGLRGRSALGACGPGLAERARSLPHLGPSGVKPAKGPSGGHPRPARPGARRPSDHGTRRGPATAKSPRSPARRRALGVTRRRRRADKTPRRACARRGRAQRGRWAPAAVPARQPVSRSGPSADGPAPTWVQKSSAPRLGPPRDPREEADRPHTHAPVEAGPRPGPRPPLARARARARPPVPTRRAPVRAERTPGAGGA